MSLLWEELPGLRIVHSSLHFSLQMEKLYTYYEALLQLRLLTQRQSKSLANISLRENAIYELHYFFFFAKKYFNFSYSHTK